MAKENLQKCTKMTINIFKSCNSALSRYSVVQAVVFFAPTHSDRFKAQTSFGKSDFMKNVVRDIFFFFSLVRSQTATLLKQQQQFTKLRKRAFILKLIHSLIFAWKILNFSNTFFAAYFIFKYTRLLFRNVSQRRLICKIQQKK